MYAMASKMGNFLFGNWLEAELKEREMTQADLARSAGVTRGAINGVITGARGPGIDLCQAIARAFQIPPEEVFRQAGFLPFKSETNEMIERATYLIENYKHPETKERALDYLEHLMVQELKGKYDTHTSQEIKPSESG
jgi:transcriptional regulator with XRE-family HTH domain